MRLKLSAYHHLNRCLQVKTRHGNCLKISFTALTEHYNDDDDDDDNSNSNSNST